MEKKRSWACTLVVQFFLCISIYLSLNLGQSLKSIYYTRDGRTRTRPHDVYFLSVRGGYRSLKQQIHLLKLMENVAEAYKAKFVVNISELGEDDPLTQNASRLFSSMNVPWYNIQLQSVLVFGTFLLLAKFCSCHISDPDRYTTRASKGSKIDCFLGQINITRGKMLTVAGVDTKYLQDLMLAGSTSGFGNNQLNWLTQTLEAATKSWFIVVGYHPVVVCEKKEEQVETKLVYEPLHRIFMNYGVNAYLSTQGCINHTLQGGVAYIGITDPIKNEPYSAPSNGSFTFGGEVDDGFLLHRVSSLEITTYFVSLRGEVVNKIVIQQEGKAVL